MGASRPGNGMYNTKLAVPETVQEGVVSFGSPSPSYPSGQEASRLELGERQRVVGRVAVSSLDGPPGTPTMAFFPSCWDKGWCP